MAFDLPSLAALGKRVREAFRAELPGSDAWLWPNNIAVSAKVIALACYEHFIRLGWLHRQLFATTADRDHLIRHGAEVGLTLKGPSYAEGFLDWTGQPGTPVAVGTLFQRSDGLQYRLVDPAVMSANGFATLRVRATVTGKIGNTDPGASFTLGEILANIDPTGTVASDAIGGGAEIEDIEEFRARVLFRKRNTPMGGAVSDYYLWAAQLPGVNIGRVMVDPLAYGLGTVGIWYMMDDVYADGLPRGADIEAMQAHLSALAPATAIVCVKQPNPVRVDMVVRGLTPATQAVRDAASAEIAEAFIMRGSIGRASRPTIFSRSWIWQAIAGATGESRHELIAPASDPVLPRGAVAVPGTITWQS